MTRPHLVRQPGPARMPRVVAIEAGAQSFDFDLESGLPLLEAVRRGLAARGFDSGVIELENVMLGPFAYVMPALSKTPSNAAFYSEVFRPEGVTCLTRGCMTFGARDDSPFFHCHGLWREADGRDSGGHVLPDETRVAAPTRIRAVGLDGAGFIAEPDPEINFTVFGPAPTIRTGAARGARALAVRLRPHQDLFMALESLCEANGFTRARIRGGVGSTIGARFEDGRIVENFATEVFILDGRIAPDPDGRARARIAAGLIDHTGAIAQGVLLRGDNPVLMTFELVLTEET